MGLAQKQWGTPPPPTGQTGVRSGEKLLLTTQKGLVFQTEESWLTTLPPSIWEQQKGSECGEKCSPAPFV